MSETVKAPPKPEFGSPCNGCGFCCAAEVCALGEAILGTSQAPCPAMEFDDERFYCGLVRTPHVYYKTAPVFDDFLRKQAIELLGVGRGCDSDVEIPEVTA